MRVTTTSLKLESLDVWLDFDLGFGFALAGGARLDFLTFDGVGLGAMVGQKWSAKAKLTRGRSTGE